MQHHQSTMCIFHGMIASNERYLHNPTSESIILILFASSKWCWPTVSSINKGMHASFVACAHRRGNFGVIQLKAASPKASALKENHIGQRQAISANEKQHRLNGICSGLQHWPLPIHVAMLSLGVDLSHQLWPVYITQRSWSLTFPHRFWHAYNGQPVSDVGYPPHP